MRRIILTILCAAYLITCHAQKKQESLVISYYTLYRYFEETPLPTEREYLLKITKSSSVFEECLPQGDTVHEPKLIIKNYPKDGHLTFTGCPLKRVTYTEPIPQFEWELEEGDAAVCGYHCQSAKTSFRGRTWTVWYTTDIPIDDGPWKLCGLPGLILKAEDSKGDFSFTAYKIKKVKEKPFKISLGSYIKTTPQQMAEYTRLSFQDYEKLVDLMTGRLQHPTSTNKSSEQGQKTACLLEYFDKE